MAEDIPKRRSTDNGDHEVRISILEQLTLSCDKSRTETNVRIDNLEERLDTSMQNTAQSQLAMTNSVTRLVTSVEAMADDIKTALTGSLLAVKHETIVTALMWAGTVLAGLVGAGWTLFLYFKG